MRARGFTLQETMIVMLLAFLATAVSIPLIRGAYQDLEDGDLAKLLETCIQTVRSNYEQSTSYTGVSAAEVIPHLPQKWVLNTLPTPTIRHPLNGSLTIAADGTDPTLFNMTLTVQRDDTCRRVVLAGWPVVDSILVDGTAVKTAAGQAMPTEATLAARCTAAAHNIVLQSD